MKRFAVILSFAVFTFTWTAEAQHSTPCPDFDSIANCPDEGCGGDPDLNRQKNIRNPPEGPAKLMTIKELKEKPNPSTQRFRSDNRDRSVLREMGEGDKIMVVAWLLTVRRGVLETCNCKIDLAGKNKYLVRDNHMVLVDPSLKRPTLARNEAHSVAAEFTPRVKLDHPNFGRAKLNPLIDENWTESKANPTGKLKVRDDRGIDVRFRTLFRNTSRSGKMIGRYTLFSKWNTARRTKPAPARAMITGWI